MNDMNKGIYSKYIVTKADGTPLDGDCFVLRPDRDNAAVKALLAYAASTPNEELSSDIRIWLASIGADMNAPDEIADLRRRAENNQTCYVSEAAECERLRMELAAYKARWTETASDNTEYTLAHLDGIYTVCDPDGCVVCEFIRDAALEGGPQ